MTNQDALVGSHFQGRYEFGRELGRGGFGRVLLATQISTGQKVAIKLFMGDLLADRSDESLARFRRETKLCATLHHPYIVRLIDAGEDENGRPYSVFEYVPGDTLATYLRKHGKLGVSEAVELLGQVLDALAAAHRAGVIHRDIKPENIMITRSGVRPHAKVLDFGIGALLEPSRSSTMLELTDSNRFIGTPAYAAPEQIRAGPVTAAADLYAWGLVTLEALTGKRVISGHSLKEVLNMQLSSEPIPLPSGLEQTALGEVLATVLARRPEDRRLTAAEAVHRLFALDTGAAASPPLALGPTISAQAPELREREQRLLAVAACELRLDSTGLDLETYDERLRAARKAMGNAVESLGAKIDGDGRTSLVAYFGLGRARESDARQAADTAQMMLRTLAEAKLPGLSGAVGIHVGLALVGPTSSPRGYAFDGARELAQRAAPGQVWVSGSAGDFLARHYAIEPAAELALPGEGLGPCFELGPAFDAALPRGLGELSPFRGRDEELELLGRRIERALAGDGHSVLVTGDAGIGKSRLLSQLMSATQTHGVNWLWCQCKEEDRGRALAPIEELLGGQLTPRAETSPEERLASLEENLQRIGLTSEFDYLATLLGLSDSHSNDRPEILRYKTLDAIIAVLLSFAAEQPLVLVVEDLHWADPSTVELLGLLSEQVEDHPLLLLATTRPEFSAPWTQRTMQIPLGKLDGETARALARAYDEAQSEALPSALVDAVLERANGIPYYIEELMRAVIRRHRAGARVHTLDELGIPPTLRGLLQARLDRLSNSAKKVLRMAAILGVEFRSQWLALLEPSQASREAALAELIEAKLLRRGRRYGQLIHSFGHALVREVVYETMLGSKRRELHASVADTFTRNLLVTQTLVDGVPAAEPKIERPDLIAHHFACANELAAAIPYEYAAALASLKRSANVEASQHARRALGWLETIDEPRARAERELELNAVLAPALMAVAGYASPELLPVLERSVELLAEVGASPHAFPAFWSMCLFSLMSCQYDRSLELGHELLRRAREAENVVEIAAASALVANVHNARGEANEARAASIDCIELWDTKAHSDFVFAYGLDPHLVSLGILSGTTYLQGETELADAYAERTLSAARSLGHLQSLGGLLFGLAGSYRDRGDRAKVIALTDELRSLAADHTQTLNILYGNLLRAWAERSLSAAREVLDSLMAINMVMGMPYWSSIVAELELEAGEFDAAATRIDTWLPQIGALGGGLYETEIRHIRARIARAQGDEATALEQIRAAVEAGDRRGTHVLAHRATREWLELEPTSAEAQQALERCEAQLAKAAGSESPPGV